MLTVKSDRDDGILFALLTQAFLILIFIITKYFWNERPRPAAPAFFVLPSFKQG